MKKTNKGFTLAEMLIVVAIIGVLIAIIVPAFSTQLEKARETTDAANIRSKIAELTSKALTEDAAQTDYVEIKQKVKGWESKVEVGGASLPAYNAVSTEKYYKVEVSASGDVVLSISSGNK